MALQVIDQSRLVFGRVGGSGSQPVARYDDIAPGLFEFADMVKVLEDWDASQAG